ncbi:DUF1798 family protein [Oceanobacillus senegalensis]|uniref:DUF1798 family protein n=1 Tax=Oceanobacillus senegalensis TaxID=1936063 RepID=UPI000A3118F2|nr:DUF1798 family protein [Oceanobacillus senegalensis]
MNVQELTVSLQRDLEQLKKRFDEEEPPENMRDKSFFLTVKEQTTPIFEQLEDWESKALAIVKKRKVTIHPQQVTSTKENMDLLIMHSYYKDLRRRRYMEYYKSIKYIFEQLLAEMSSTSWTEEQ